MAYPTLTPEKQVLVDKLRRPDPEEERIKAMLRLHQQTSPATPQQGKPDFYPQRPKPEPESM